MTRIEKAKLISKNDNYIRYSDRHVIALLNCRDLVEKINIIALSNEFIEISSVCIEMDSAIARTFKIE